MKTWILLLIVGLVAAGAAAGAYFWYSMRQPLYQPGNVRNGENLRAPLEPPQQPAAGEFWSVEPDVQLYHFSQGTGRDVLVVHGGPGQPYRQAWAGLEPLAGAYRFHYYDQRGSGKSTRPVNRLEGKNYYANMQSVEQTLGIGAQLADIERIRRILGEEKLVLIGHSWGAFLASLYAAEFPEHVEALVLVSPADMLVMGGGEGGGLFEEVRARLPEPDRAEFDEFMQRYFAFNDLFSKSEADLAALNTEFGRFYAQAVGSNPVLAEQGEPGGWMVFAQYLSLGQQHDYRPALNDVHVPVLVLHGADDLQNEAVSRAYAETFPGAQFQVINGATHFAFDERPAEFATLVQTFLAGQ